MLVSTSGNRKLRTPGHQQIKKKKKIGLGEAGRASDCTVIHLFIVLVGLQALVAVARLHSVLVSENRGDY